MTAIIYQFVPKPNPDREKREAELKDQAAGLMHEVLFGAPIYASADLVTLHAPDKDPA